MQRRKFLTSSAASSLWLMTGCGGGGSSTSPPSSSLTLITGSPLAIPPLLDPTAVNGVKQYDLAIQESTHSFFTTVNSSTYGFNQSYLGPTLLLKNGDDVSINFQNNLMEATTVHGHGMHLPAVMDGGPHQTIAAGASWSAQYRVNQKACSNWYHPHLMGKTAEHVYHGLAGMIIIEDSESQALALPKTYGVDDIPLVVQDRVFDTDGQISYAPTNMQIMQGYRGNTLITNGQVAPSFTANAGLLRLRLLNGSNAGMYRFSFSDNRQFHQIATDNSFLEQPVAVTSVLLSPAERVEIVVDLTNDAGLSLALKVLEEIGGLDRVSLDISVSSQASAVTSLPASLTSLGLLDPTSATNTRSFILEGSGMGGSPTLTINGAAMDINVVNETVPLNQTEIWEITNRMNIPHNFHIHATHFRIIDRNNDAALVGENEKGFKDTVYMPPNSSARFLVTMIDYADANGKYMYHCHFLEHEDAGMMGQFVVI